jgi:ABC-2 type transport system ATP-binding protein
MIPVVRAEGLTKRWGATLALDDASFEVGPGITGLLGPNGAGKTTMLGLMLGLYQSDGGTISVLDRDPWHAGPEVRARIGWAPEHDALPPDVPAFDAVRHLAEVHGLPGTEAAGRASDALWVVGLGEERFRAVGTMSTGQRQRVKLAQAIAHDPSLVLLDEPTNGLDPVQRDEMLGLIRHVGRDLGLNVVLSSHLLEEVERTCDAVVILDAGRVVEQGAIADLRATGDIRAEVIVEVDGGPDAVAALADRLAGVTVDVDGSRLVVAFNGDETYDVVRDAIADAGIALRRLQRRTRSLEDVYLEAHQ